MSSRWIMFWSVVLLLGRIALVVFGALFIVVGIGAAIQAFSGGATMTKVLAVFMAITGAWIALASGAAIHSEWRSGRYSRRWAEDATNR